MLDHGADIEAGNQGPEAAAGGTPLYLAAAGGQLEMIRLLLARSARPAGHSPGESAARRDRARRNPTTDTLLHIAARKKLPQRVALLAMHHDPDPSITCRRSAFRLPLPAGPAVRAGRHGWAQVDRGHRHADLVGFVIDYRIYEHFGAGLHDAGSNLFGLPALFFLQHRKAVPGHKYTPFVSSAELRQGTC